MSSAADTFAPDIQSSNPGAEFSKLAHNAPHTTHAEQPQAKALPQAGDVVHADSVSRRIARDASLGHGLIHPDEFAQAQAQQNQAFLNAQQMAQMPVNTDLATQQVILLLIQGGIESARMQAKAFADDRGKSKAVGAEKAEQAGLLPGLEVETQATATPE